MNRAFKVLFFCVWENYSRVQMGMNCLFIGWGWIILWINRCLAVLSPASSSGCPLRGSTWRRQGREARVLPLRGRSPEVKHLFVWRTVRAHLYRRVIYTEGSCTCFQPHGQHAFTSLGWFIKWHTVCMLAREHCGVLGGEVQCCPAGYISLLTIDRGRRPMSLSDFKT